LICIKTSGRKFSSKRLKTSQNQGIYRGNKSAGGGSRTHTHGEVNWILSPVRLLS